MADIIWVKSNFIKKCIMMYKNTALSKTGLYFYWNSAWCKLLDAEGNLTCQGFF